jgi:hypothetical protein
MAESNNKVLLAATNITTTLSCFNNKKHITLKDYVKFCVPVLCIGSTLSDINIAQQMIPLISISEYIALHCGLSGITHIQGNSFDENSQQFSKIVVAQTTPDCSFSKKS